MPGSNAKAIAKARTLPADVIVMDLEDAVAPDAKANARSMVLEALSQVIVLHALQLFFEYY
jgi:citrate lyase subunit beta/citryl-CoA lyase